MSPDPATADDPPAPTRPSNPTAVPVLLGAAVRTLVGRPRAFAPFLLAAVVAGVADAVLVAGPVPAAVRTLQSEGLLTVRVAVFPGTVAAVVPRTWSLLGLELPFLAAVVGSGAATLATTAVAATWTLSRPGLVDPDRGVDLRRAGPMALYLAAVLGATWTVDALAAAAPPGVGGILTGVGLLGSAYLLARLFVVPARITAGRPVRGAVADSLAATRGRVLSLSFVILALGMAGFWATSVPGILVDTLPVAPGGTAATLGAGTALGVALVGPVHAAAVAVADERLVDD